MEGKPLDGGKGFSFEILYHGRLWNKNNRVMAFIRSTGRGWKHICLGWGG